MEPVDFVRKWKASTLKESAAAHSHFLDLCELLEVAKPSDEDVEGKHYTFEKQTAKANGRMGFADVWKQGHFAWEYKGPGKNLDTAYKQLQQYKGSLGNPPLLVVSDTRTIRVHTDWTNYITEVYEVALEDLLDSKNRQLLKDLFESPSALKPKRTRDELTRDAAQDFSDLAQRLRNRGHGAQTVAHFVNRLVFCMFAEDVNLLPNKLFQRSMELAVKSPQEAQENLTDLFRAMSKGGRVGFETVQHFNGGLFDDDTALPLEKEDVKLLVEAAKLDWSEIDPSIFGTLFERGLDPSKRGQLGAHYTDAEKIMMIVEPVIIEPLTAEWEEVRAKIEAELAKAAKGKGATRTRACNKAEKLHAEFIEKLAKFRVLDPACGSGNFLYLSLKALKDIEQHANSEAEDLGLPRGFPRVGPGNVLGIEINPYAAELARVSVWIGDIQWMRKKGFGTSTPILRLLSNIENRDALIEQDPETGEWREAEWPEAEVIVGNPPFLGSKFFRKGKPATRSAPAVEGFGDKYTDALLAVFDGRLPGSSNLVAYWFAQANRTVCSTIERIGLVFTKSALKGVSNKALKWLLDDCELKITTARSNVRWMIDGAAVRVAIACAEKYSPRSVATLDGEVVARLNSDFSTGVDITGAARLAQNRRRVFQGVKQNGPFEMDGTRAHEILNAPVNPNGRPNRDVVIRFFGNDDVTQRTQMNWIVDFTGFPDLRDACLYEQPFKFLDGVRHHRASLVKSSASEDSKLDSYWLMQRPRTKLRDAMEKLHRVICVPETSEHLIFRFLPADRAVFSGSLFVVCRSDFTSFGVLLSDVHRFWAQAKGNDLGVGDQNRYNSTSTFETFPFPEGLTPDIPADQYADDPRAIRIAEAAERLNTLRENWLNPEDLVIREPEVVEGYPDRILPKDEEAAKILKKRTLTNLYNERPAWLDQAHAELDRAVAAAYSWEDDWEAGMDEEEILERLFDLNQQRAANQ